MRCIGEFPTENEAVVFTSILYVSGIETQIEHEEKGEISVWVLDDDKLVEARELLQQFRVNPEAPEFQNVIAVAKKKRTIELSQEKGRKSVVTDIERVQYAKNYRAFAWLPAFLIIICVASGIWTETLDELMDTKGNPETIGLLAITAKMGVLDVKDGFKYKPNRRYLPEIEHGAVWRLVTPAFIHYGLLHLVFNMLWLRNLGGYIENRFGVAYLLMLVVIAAATSNLMQFYMSGANSGGMSGVNYGLFGFLWLRGKYDRKFGWEMNPMIVQSMLVWFFIGLVNVVPGMANTAHGVGLLVGMAWGFVSAKIAAMRR